MFAITAVAVIPLAAIPFASDPFEAGFAVDERSLPAAHDGSARGRAKSLPPRACYGDDL